MKLYIETGLKLKTILYYCVSFLYGFVLMSVEMLGSRMLAPYFGSGIYVWANLIGIFMLSIALGSYIGGKLSTKKMSFLIVSTIGLVLLLYIGATHKAIFEWISNWGNSDALVQYGSQNANAARSVNFDRIVKPLTACIIVFFPLIFVLSMVSPIIIKKLSFSVEVTGKVSGRVYAVSTAGNLLGTFLTSFYLIVKYHTAKIIYIMFAIFIINIILITIFRLDLFHVKENE